MRLDLRHEMSTLRLNLAARVSCIHDASLTLYGILPILFFVGEVKLLFWRRSGRLHWQIAALTHSALSSSRHGSDVGRDLRQSARIVRFRSVSPWLDVVWSRSVNVVCGLGHAGL